MNPTQLHYRVTASFRKASQSITSEFLKFVFLYERHTYTIARMRQASVEVVAIAGFELGKGCVGCQESARPASGRCLSAERSGAAEAFTPLV